MEFHGDDISYSRILNYRTIDNVILRFYNNWSSRVIITVIQVILTRITPLWIIIDSILYTTAVYYIIQFVNNTKNKNLVLLGVLLFLLYPYYEMGTSGWVAASLNYLWVFALGVVSLIPLFNESKNKKTSKFIYLLAIIGLIYSTNQEQGCALILGFNLVYLIYNYYKYKKISKYNLFAIAVAVISVILIIKCPGNQLRYASEIARRFPEYANYGLIEKVYLGIVPSVAVLLEDKILFAVSYTILCICTSLKIKNKNLRYIIYFSLIFILCITFGRTLFFNIYPGFKTVFSVITFEGVPNLYDKSTWAAFLICVWIIVSSCLMLLKIFGRKNLMPLIIFGAGFMSRFIMGFSPTVFASHARTSIFFYMSMIMVDLMVINDLYANNHINRQNELKINLILIAIAIAYYINIFVLMNDYYY